MRLSSIVIAKNEEGMIADCLDSLSFSDEIIVVDNASSDRTQQLAQRMGAKVFTKKTDDFSELRNFGLEKAQGEWVLYVDADERVDAQLRENIEYLVRGYQTRFARLPHAASDARSAISRKQKASRSLSESLSQPLDSKNSRSAFNSLADGQARRPSAYKLRRKNFYFGNHPWPYIEEIPRLFEKSRLKGWHGKVHESPVFEGNAGILDGYLLHYTHRDLKSMVEKTNQWSEIEAKLRFEAGHPKMTWWRFIRVMLTAFLNSYLKQKGYKAGTAGIVESIYQAFSAFITYAKLWELQQKDPK